MIAQPMKCKCQAPAQGPVWSVSARRHIVRCSREGCPAVSQHKDKSGAVERWNRMASKA